MASESAYQRRLIKKLKDLFPGCLVQKNDEQYRQGVPDLVIFFEDKWAMLEVKASSSSQLQPNQEHYIERLNSMSFAAFIYPENEEEVLRGLQQAFRTER